MKVKMKIKNTHSAFGNTVGGRVMHALWRMNKFGGLADVYHMKSTYSYAHVFLSMSRAPAVNPSTHTLHLSPKNKSTRTHFTVN